MEGTEMRVLAIVFLLSMQEASACGHCVEDKIAAVYDHSAVSRSLGAGRTVVFFSIDGELKPGAAASAKTRARLEKLAAGVPGVEPASARASAEAAALAIAYDPKRTGLAEVQKALEQRLKMPLLAMRVMDRPGDLAAVRAP